MIEPRRALVRPRVHSPQSGEPVLLEELIVSLIGDAARPGAVALLGGPGEGKSTALAHLAAVLEPCPQVCFLDEPSVDELRTQTERHFVILTRQALPTERSSILGLRLAGWERDDWIEYLLATHKDRCCSVLGRIQAHDRALLMGKPQLWSIVLEALAADDALPDASMALLRHVDEQLADPEEMRRLTLACLEAVTQGRSQARMQLTDSQWRLLRHDAVHRLLMARRIAADLAENVRGAYLAHPWPKAIVILTARFLAGNGPAQECLERVFDRRQTAQAMTASLLYALDRAWRPKSIVVSLSRAYLDGVAWAGVSLEAADLTHAHLAGADLSEADLRHAMLTSADLAGANLHSAKLPQSHAVKANLRQADLTDIQAYGANWDEADLSRTIGVKADFRVANLRGANLERGDFRGAGFMGTNLLGAKIDGADFSAANFERANLTRLPLRTACCAGAIFRWARLVGCDLEYLELAEADFTSARLSRALLTGTVMHNASFRNAILRKTGLADIDWENADLRGADMRGASFHLGSTRSGLVGSPIASEGTRTGFYTDDFTEQDFKSPEDIRKANLRGADLRGARLDGVDFYLVDLRGARFDASMEGHLRSCGAILEERL